MAIGRIGSKNIEAIPTGVGFDFNLPTAPDPAIASGRVMQKMNGIYKVNFAIFTQALFFSAYKATNAACWSASALAGTTLGLW